MSFSKNDFFLAAGFGFGGSGSSNFGTPRVTSSTIEICSSTSPPPIV